MMHARKAFLVFFSITAATFLSSSQLFAMGAKRPDTTTTTTTNSASTNILGQLINSVLPLATTSLGAGSLGSWSGIITPILGNITNQNQGSTNGNAYLEQIASLALDSACADHSWKNLGSAPADFLTKTTLNYARGICQLTKSQASLIIPTTALNALLKGALANFQTTHAGFAPITVSELSAVPACNQLFNDVEDLIANDQYSCQDI